MSHRLRRAALATAAAAAVSAALLRGGASDDSPTSPYRGRSPSPAYAAAPGHHGLARAHGVLGALITPEALLTDAAHALAAAVLRVRPFSGEDVRLMRRSGHAAALIAEAAAEEAWYLRIQLALLDAEDGRFDDALDELARLAAERPSDPRPRLSASGICYLIGRREQGDQWISGIPDRQVRQKNARYQRRAVLAAALGGAPGAVAGFEGLVGWSAFVVLDLALLAMFVDGDISFLQRVLLRTLLWRGLVASKYEDFCKSKGKDTAAAAQPKDDIDRDGSI